MLRHGKRDARLDQIQIKESNLNGHFLFGLQEKEEFNGRKRKRIKQAV